MMAYRRRQSASLDGINHRSFSPPRQPVPQEISAALGSVTPSCISSEQLPPPKRRSLRPQDLHVFTPTEIQNENNYLEDGEEAQETSLLEEPDAFNDVIMAIDMKTRGDSTGCAYYVARDEKLWLMGDVKLGGQEILERMKLHAQPTVVLVSTKLDEVLEEALGKDARGFDRENETSE